MTRVVASLIVAVVVAACGNDSNSTSSETAPVESEAMAEAPETEPVVAVTEPGTTEPPITEPEVTESGSVVTEAEVAVTEPPEAAPSDTQPDEPVDSEPVATDAAIEAAAWTEIVPTSPDCACSDGSEFSFFERPGDPTKVMFYFEGGGACFNAETCDPVTGTYTATIAQTTDFLAQREGLFDVTNDENPLADHSVVYVPYCTGDVHIGNATTEYSDELTIEHRGYANALAALDHLVATYPDVEELVVTGASAGSVPTPLVAGLASDALPDADIVTFGDSSAAYPDVPALNETIGTLWGTTNAIPDWPETDGISAAEWSIPGLYSAAGAHDPDITFGRFDYAFDEVQATFAALAGVGADELVTLIDDNEAQIEATGVPVASYVAPGTAHTIMASDLVYELEVEGVPLIDWITMLVTGDVPDDVHCVECTAP